MPAEMSMAITARKCAARCTVPNPVPEPTSRHNADGSSRPRRQASGRPTNSSGRRRFSQSGANSSNRSVISVATSGVHDASSPATDRVTARTG